MFDVIRTWLSSRLIFLPFDLLYESRVSIRPYTGRPDGFLPDLVFCNISSLEPDFNIGTRLDLFVYRPFISDLSVTVDLTRSVIDFSIFSISSFDILAGILSS